MRQHLLLLALAASLFGTGHAHAFSNTLPDACGADDLKFDVKTSSASDAQPAPVPPEGKALIVFVSTVGGLGPPPVRFGVDGAWAGAAKGKSFFAYTVEPGQRHVCYSVKGKKDLVGAASVSAEAGKTYFFEFRIDLQKGRGTMMSGGQMGTVQTASLSSGFKQLDEDQGKFLIKTYAQANSTPGK